MYRIFNYSNVKNPVGTKCEQRVEEHRMNGDRSDAFAGFAACESQQFATWMEVQNTLCQQDLKPHFCPGGAGGQN